MILEGKQVLVPGAGRGIGRAIARICHQEGAKVAICARTRADLLETAANRDMDCYTCDVCNQDQINGMVQAIYDKWGAIDILINNAGGGQPTKGPAATLDGDDLTRLLSLNVVAVHRVSSAVLQAGMKQHGGQIIMISSRAGKQGLPNVSFYVASKFALEGYSATLAKELKNDNVIVHTLSPGMVDTQSFPKSKGKPGVRKPEDIRDALMLLFQADQSSTGHYMHADELDQVRAAGRDDSKALKPIDEAVFQTATL